MSTILKALDRLERDREEQPGEISLREQLAREPDPKRGSSLKLFAFIAVCGGATGAVVAALVMGDGGGVSPRLAAVGPVASAPRAVTTPSDEAGPSRPPTLAAVSAQSDERPARPVLESSPDPGGPLESAASGTASSLALEASANAPSPGLEAQPNVVYGSAELPPAALQSEVALVARPVAPPPPEPVPQPVAASNSHPKRSWAPPPLPAVEVAPKRAAPPMAARATPDVRVARTVWHPTPSRRYALVGVAGSEEPIQVREGDSVGSALVSEIDPAGVVFLRDEVEFYRGVSGQR